MAAVRLSLAEWLLLFMMFVPLLAGAAFCVYVRQTHFERIEGYREHGAERIAEWLEREPEWVVGWTQRLRSDVQPRAKDVPFSVDGEPGLVRFDAPPSSTAPWTFTQSYAGSYRADALGATDARVGIESGDGGQYLEPGAALFVDLFATPNLERLRGAPLPARSKLYLLNRWPGDYVEAKLVVRAALCTGAQPPGIHEVDGLFVLSSGEAQLICVSRPDARLAWPISRDRRMRLRYEGTERQRIGLGGGSPRNTTELWSGRLETPVAGTWTLDAIDLGTWQDDPFFLRWAGPVSIAVLALFLIPAGIFLAVRRLRQLDHARVRFINELAHDLRTPLTSVRMHAELLAMGRAPAGDNERYVSVLARESARLSGVLANLLDLSHLERGRRVFTLTPVPVKNAVDEAIRDFVSLYPEREQDVRTSGDDDTILNVDRTALARCLANLLDNAGKYTPVGTAVRVEWRDAEITVYDDGPGVAPRDRAKLFRRYVRGRDAGRDGVPGTGMGLALVRELAEGMGGSVRYEPRATGACFVLSFR